MDFFKIIVIAIACGAFWFLGYLFGYMLGKNKTNTLYDDGYSDGYKAGYGDAESRQQLDLEDDDTPECDPVVFGRYCMMEHQPEDREPYAVYPYDVMHAEDGGEFRFSHRSDAIEYMGIYDRRAEQFQRRDNRLNNFNDDYGIPKEPDPIENQEDWDPWPLPLCGGVALCGVSSEEERLG